MRQASKIPGHAARVAAGVGKEHAGEGDPKLDAECLERFIKVSVKHITDGEGVVGGTLLVTPNAVMFDPNVSDPLVLEHSADKYGMMAPIETVMSAAIYHDIAAMRLSTSTDEPVQSEVYHVSDCPNNENCSCSQAQAAEDPDEKLDRDKEKQEREGEKEKLEDTEDEKDKTLEGNSVESGLGEDITSTDNDDNKTKKTPCPISIPAQASGDSESGPKSGSLIGRTLGSLGSSIGSFPASPNLSSIVDFSSGFFKGATNEEGSSSDKETSVESAVKADEKPELFKSLEGLYLQIILYFNYKQIIRKIFFTPSKIFCSKQH